MSAARAHQIVAVAVMGLIDRLCAGARWAARWLGVALVFVIMAGSSLTAANLVWISLGWLS